MNGVQTWVKRSWMRTELVNLLAIENTDVST